MKAKKGVLLLIGTALVVGAGTVAMKQKKQIQRKITRAYKRWHPVTVNRQSSSVTLRSRELKPLVDLGEAVEIRIRPVPGDRGTEIAARLNYNSLDEQEYRSTLQKMRAALRDVQSLIETGEVVKPDTESSTHKTPTGMPLDAIIRRARGGGLL